MQALEELAVSYDSKDREIEAAHSEKKLFFEEIEKLQVILNREIPRTLYVIVLIEINENSLRAT